MDLTEISRQLGSIEQSLKQLVEIRQDHELRIKSLECITTQARGGWKIIVFLVGISSGVGALIAWFASHFKP